MERGTKRRKTGRAPLSTETPTWFNCIDEGNLDSDPTTLTLPKSVWQRLSSREIQFWTLKQYCYDRVVLVETSGEAHYQITFPHGALRHQLPIPVLIQPQNLRRTIEILLDNGHPVTLLNRDPARIDARTVPLKQGPTYTPGTSYGQDWSQAGATLLSLTQSDIKQQVYNVARFDAMTKSLTMAEVHSDRALTNLVARTPPQELLANKRSISANILKLLDSLLPRTICWSHARAVSGAASVEEKITKRLNGPWPEALSRAKLKPVSLLPIVQLIEYEHRLREDFVDLYKAEWLDEVQGPGAILHDNTPENLELHQDSFDGQTKDSLFSQLNRCITPSGKVLLRQWVDRPPYDASAIQRRADWVDRMISTRLQNLDWNKIPNLAKLLQRIENGQCTAKDLAETLMGYRTASKILSSIRGLCSTQVFEAEYNFHLSSLDDLLNEWDALFNWSATRDTTLLQLNQGHDVEFDKHKDMIQKTTTERDGLKAHYHAQCSTNTDLRVACSMNVYEFHVRKDAQVPGHWKFLRLLGAYKAYQAPQDFHDLATRLDGQTEGFQKEARRVCSQLRDKFMNRINDWKIALDVLSEMDCFLAMAEFSRSLDLPKCRPKLSSASRPNIQCKSLRHPYLRTETGVTPNDVYLGGQYDNFWFLTAPNGGGKSTLMRTICVLVIMAQIGCYVPAESMELTPIKHIFTRMGAEDNICSGKSTFHHELEETLRIVDEASDSALVMIDELGRGTSSIDGDALALAVLQHLARRPDCIGVFSTHSLHLAPDVRAIGTVSLKYLRSQISDNDVCPLFVIDDGVADENYGHHCARAYGMPMQILERTKVILERQRGHEIPDTIPMEIWYNALQAEDLPYVEAYAANL